MSNKELLECIKEAVFVYRFHVGLLYHRGKYRAELLSDSEFSDGVARCDNFAAAHREFFRKIQDSVADRYEIL